MSKQSKRIIQLEHDIREKRAIIKVNMERCCHICGKELKTNRGLSIHLMRVHNEFRLDWIDATDKEEYEVYGLKQGYENAKKDILEIINKKITKYQEGELENCNFTPKDRAVAMTVLEVLKDSVTQKCPNKNEGKKDE